jgi:23S rRNA pseudouridine1911/1915/1917 synthase
LLAHGRGAVSEPQTVFAVGEGDRGKRLDVFLKQRIPGLSRARLQEAIRTRIALSWGAAPRPAARVRPGGEVRIGWTPASEELLDVSIPVIARGSGWLVVDKPAGIPVHPVSSIRENSLVRILRRQEGDESLRLVHRLDRETSGALVVASSAAAASFLSSAFERRRVWKEYLAVVAGTVGPDEGTIDLPLGRAASSRVWVRRAVVAQGETASTSFRVERRCADRTLVRVFPRTGRRHQIRVHLAALGHPVLGDLLYGRPDADYLGLVASGADPRRDGGGPRRQLLHCARLVFHDPSTREQVDVASPAPEDIEAALADGSRVA